MTKGIFYVPDSTMGHYLDGVVREKNYVKLVFRNILKVNKGVLS